MNRLLLCLLVVFLLVASPLAAAPSASVPEGEQAERVAKQWLEVIDEGDYRQSWEMAAPLFKDSVSSQNWDKALTLHRSPLGKIQSRELRNRTHFEQLPGAPKGDYWVYDFVSSFENAPEVHERITPMKVDDGSWKVSGYFISKSTFGQPATDAAK